MNIFEKLITSPFDYDGLDNGLEHIEENLITIKPMKIVYHHWKNRIKEKNDKISGWWTKPPELILDEKKEKFLEKWWKKFGGIYIEDPLGHTQCNYAMYKELPWWFRLIFFVPFIKKEHVYDIEEDK